MKRAAAPTFVVASLDQQLVRECTAMASFALASGLPVPPAVLLAIEPLSATGPGAPAPASEETGVSRAYDLGRLAWAPPSRRCSRRTSTSPRPPTTRSTNPPTGCATRWA